MRIITGCFVVVLAVALAACDGGLSDTGFEGTWERMLPSGVSMLSLRAVDDGYQVWWSKIDGVQTVRCDEQGNCEEFVGDRKVYGWTFRAFTRPESEHLFVEVTGHPVDDTTQPVSYLDRLELQPGGQELWSYQVEENGVTKDPPGGPLKFRKVADEPV